MKFTLIANFTSYLSDAYILMLHLMYQLLTSECYMLMILIRCLHINVTSYLSDPYIFILHLNVLSSSYILVIRCLHLNVTSYLSDAYILMSHLIYQKFYILYENNSYQSLFEKVRPTGIEPVT